MKHRSKKTANYVRWIKSGVIGLTLFFIAGLYLPQLRVSSQLTNKLNVPAVTEEETFSIKSTIYAGARDGSGKEVPVNLPGIEVFLRNEADGAEIGRTITDADGRFHILSELRDGNFKICWKSKDWQQGCGAEIITRKSPVQFVEPLEVTTGLKKTISSLSITAKGTTLFGQVTMRDGLPCTYQNPALGMSQESYVQVFDKTGKALTEPVKTNNDGFFALKDIIATESLSLKANCGKTSALRSLKAGRASALEQIKIDNVNPEILSVVAYDGKNAIRSAAQGQKIRIMVSARDTAGEVLKYNFILPQNAGSLGEITNNSVDWMLPELPGNFTIYAVVSDNRGGIAFKTLNIPVSSTFTPMFAGRIVDENNQPIDKATVTVNTGSTKTGPTGGFSMRATVDKRYVMNAVKAGYVPVTRVYDSSKKNSTWKMTRAFSTTVDPTGEINVVEPQRKTKGGTREGSKIKIPANSLVNTRTKEPASAPLQLNIATLDISAGELPGNNRAANKNNTDSSLISFGAVFMEVVDEKGDTYDLAPEGKRASLTLPVEPGMVRRAPRTIQAWSFDRNTAIWNILGSAQLAAGAWVLQLATISTINADLEFTNPACIQVNVDNNSTLLGAKARFTSSNFVQTFDLALDDPITMIHHLPPHIPISVDVVDSGNNVIPNIQIKDVGGPVITNPFDSGASTVPVEPPYPYSTCDRKIKLEILVPTTTGQSFLTRKGVGDNTSAQAYINVIDPLGNRATLGNWWQQNGFDPTGNTQVAGEVSSAYFNDNDLHFGREMHCLQSGANVACYVSNYASANDAQVALNNPANKAAAAATVTMEYKAIDGQPPNNRIVKFFAYSGGIASSPPLLSPDLDGNGPKGMPQLCIQCHGGNYNPTNPNAPTLADVNMLSSFREFDLDTFLYPGTNPQNLQETNFKVLNDIVVASAPSPAIQTLIANWYPGGIPPQNNSYVPPDWASNPNLYSTVVKRSCRTCHIAQPNNTAAGGASGIDFTKFDVAGVGDFKGRVFQSAFCGSGKYMPHAKVTYENFWQSANPSRPQLLSQTLFSSACAP